MAAVSISPLPHSLSSMSSRRAPLSNNPNAANSPYRATNADASKQKRSYATIQREDSYGHPPPAKKQMLETHHTLRTPPRQQSVQPSAESRVLTRKPVSSRQSAFEPKLVPARETEKSSQQTGAKAEKISEENLESMRTWQKHHRRQFPKYVFYFESGSEDARYKCTKQVIALGALEAKFFSNAVTHVITTRPIPPELGSAPSEAIPSSNNDPPSQTSQPQTINPSLLDRSSESAKPDSFGTKGKFTFDVPLTRRLGPHGQDGELRRHHGRNADVLHRARELGMKIWTLEKLQRMMTTMFDMDTGSGVAFAHNTRSNTTQGSVAAPRANREADLSQLLRNERINGPSDRDPTVASKDLVRFKGPYIYIYDIDYSQKAIMVRDYPKVAHKEDGNWPQFRSVAKGRCPFVEEVDHSQREAEKEKELLRLQRQQEKEKIMVPRTRSATEAAKMQPPRTVNHKQALADIENGPNRPATVATKQANPFNLTEQSGRGNMETSSRGTQNAFVSRAGQGRLFGGEPVASGVQPSNITSAIRSVISSTAAQPGAKVGTSKEVHGLQRKVLEKNSGGPASYGGLASSHRMTDIAAATREEINKPMKRRGQDKLALIEEDVNPSEAEQNARRAASARQAKVVQQRTLEKRDPKPGYCENCQDKFEDFEEHILSRKHRKFAEKADNWKELDALLKELDRPLREVKPLRGAQANK